MALPEQGDFSSPLIPETWGRFLAPHPFSHPITCLELGIGDGRAACWLLDNVLVLEDDRYFGVDRPLSVRACRNLSRFGEKALKAEAAVNWWWPFLPFAPLPPRHANLVYLHNGLVTSRFGLAKRLDMLWHSLSTGGVLIVDNAYPRRGGGHAKALDAFLETVQWELLWRKSQLAIIKAH